MEECLSAGTNSNPPRKTQTPIINQRYPNSSFKDNSSIDISKHIEIGSSVSHAVDLQPVKEVNENVERGTVTSADEIRAIDNNVIHLVGGPKSTHIERKFADSSIERSVANNSTYSNDISQIIESFMLGNDTQYDAHLGESVFESTTNPYVTLERYKNALLSVCMSNAKQVGDCYC